MYCYGEVAPIYRRNEVHADEPAERTKKKRGALWIAIALCNAIFL